MAGKRALSLKDAYSSAGAAGNTAFSSFSVAFLKMVYPFIFIIDLIFSIPGYVFGILSRFRFVIAVFIAPFFLILLSRPEKISLSAFFSLFYSGGSFHVGAIMSFAVIYFLVSVVLWLVRSFYGLDAWSYELRVSVLLSISEKEAAKRKNARLTLYPDTEDGVFKDLDDFRSKYADKLISL